MPRPAAIEGDEHFAVADLKEHVYVTFTGLAIILAMDGAAEPDAAWAAGALAIGVIGTALAALAADLIAHLTVHHAFPDQGEFRAMLWIGLGALTTAALPFAVLVASVLGWIGIEAALMIAAFVYVAALGVLGVHAVRGAGLSRRQKFVAFLFLVAVAVCVTIVEVIAHSH